MAGKQLDIEKIQVSQIRLRRIGVILLLAWHMLHMMIMMILWKK
ncbi:Uncharacterized protein dnm_028080 [Desulfonema magnum]|uniref:Uncharacterized protein n=1 Tax=Desulfonema magnum TaxID=45655 RepID=A0A975BKK6_9BACT|nr:Uncharacterized protein dnm_028080 [Desulfonema magnum]